MPRLTQAGVTSYAAFWLREGAGWFATVERDGAEIVRHGPYATEAEAKAVSDGLAQIMEKYGRKAWPQL